MISSKRLNSSILPITPGQRGLKINGNEEVLHIPQTPRQEPHHQMQFNAIPGTTDSFTRPFVLPSLLHFI